MATAKFLQVGCIISEVVDIVSVLVTVDRGTVLIGPKKVAFVNLLKGFWYVSLLVFLKR